MIVPLSWKRSTSCHLFKDNSRPEACRPPSSLSVWELSSLFMSLRLAALFAALAFGVDSAAA